MAQRIRIPVRPGLPVVAALAVVVLAATGGPVRAAATPSNRLPDLVADPPAKPTLEFRVDSTGNQQDLLLRFDGYIHNAGAGPFEVQGSRPNTSRPMTPHQRIYRTDGTFHDYVMPSNTELFFSNADGHNHWHLQNIARYSLWNKGRSAEVAPARKVGFCLEDSEHVNPFGPPDTAYSDAQGRNFCQKKKPDALSLFEGVSSGWRDVYRRNLTLQWVVVSDVLPGRYWLREDIDTEDIVNESNETNAPAWSTSAFEVPGYLAKPVKPPARPVGKQQQVTLATDSFGSPGPRRFRVIAGPSHGELSVTTGARFENPVVRYTPAAGYSGPDKFTYQALDSTSRYPLSPQVATVSLSVAGTPEPSVVIDSAPTRVQVGRGVQLHATVKNDLRAVVWSVNGVDGGGAGAGTITASGFYTAPPSPPPKPVKIRARSASGAHDQRVVRITVPRYPSPSPWVDDPQPARGALLGRIATTLQGHILVAGVTPGRAGVVSMHARAGNHHRLGSCRTRTPKGRHFTCRFNAPPGVSLSKLKLAARLTLHGRVVAAVYRSGAPARR